MLHSLARRGAVTLLALATISIAPPRQAAPPDSLPRVLLLGDSISIGYTKPVQELLRGLADVRRNPGNARHTGHGLEHLDAWLGDGAWDVVHFNWGLHDLCYREADGRGRDKLNGSLQTTVEQYEANLERLVTRLERTGARMIWASTTPVPAGEPGRFEGAELTYNAAAARVMERHGVRVDDLHALVAGRMESLQVKPGDVHFTPAGSRALARQVADHVSDALGQAELARRAKDEPRSAPPNVVFVLADDLGWTGM